MSMMVLVGCPITINQRRCCLVVVDGSLILSGQTVDEEIDRFFSNVRISKSTTFWNFLN
jgi:hypothetical protein